MSDRKPLLGGGAKETPGEGYDRVQAELRRLQTQIRTGLRQGIPYTSEMEAHAGRLIKQSDKFREQMLKEARKIKVPKDLPPLPDEKKALEALGKSEKQLKEEMRKAEARAKARASPVRGGAKPKTAGGGAKPKKKK